MIRILLLAVLMIVIANAFWRLVDGIIDAAGGTSRDARRGRGGPPPAVRLARDPVCGTHVPTNAALSLTAGGQTKYFCSEKCRDEYLRRS